ncbi:MAG: hypothetical protein QHI38_05250 [Armatimonadota bacterium]|nr:hypothetical protein [Armatimonadota bacterium]
MNPRIPVAILALLVLVALVWRIANPPAPPMPGPLGTIPTWDSQTKIGNMSSCAVSPSGQYWAGAWNEKKKDGELRSAVLVIDLERSRSYQQPMKTGFFVTSIGWADDANLWALLINSDSPEGATQAKLAWIRRAGKDRLNYDLSALKEPVVRILDWPERSKLFLGEIRRASAPRVGVFNRQGNVVGKLVDAPVPRGSSLGKTGALSSNGRLFVFSIIEDKIGGAVSYYLGDSTSGTAKRIFGSEQLPGRVEDLWVSPYGVLVACAERENFHVLVYPLAAPRPKLTAIQQLKLRPDELSKYWPDAPRVMMFATYNGGYALDMATGKLRQLFDLTKLDRYSDVWRRQIQDGRLYPRKDGDYTSVSVLADEVDIRVIRKSGDRGPNILPRR